MDRRDCLRTMCVAAGSAVLGPRAEARGAGTDEARGGEAMGVLVDTTRCIGCRTCEGACAEANHLPEPPADVDPARPRPTSPTQWTVVNTFQTDKGEVYAKRQCMHCLQPACASACLTRAMHKTPEGAVAWDGTKCMGCRFCMVACPFDVPKFEYDSPNPRIRKCVLCWEKLRLGQAPACAAACPAEALRFGSRAGLIETAWRRIYDEPDRYVHHVYGEREAGGTLVLYLSAVPFAQLGLPANLGETPYPEHTRDFLYAVPFTLTLVPPFLLALSRASQARRAAEETAEGEI